MGMGKLTGKQSGEVKAENVGKIEHKLKEESRLGRFLVGPNQPKHFNKP